MSCGVNEEGSMEAVGLSQPGDHNMSILKTYTELKCFRSPYFEVIDIELKFEPCSKSAVFTIQHVGDHNHKDRNLSVATGFTANI
ncbi:hypothetical protein X801_05942 [Opisthorchis viverrini]|uniref:Uncharacterized protein n=1 Tax=Opisthorchis viverrini TaxID=6198 RepID=A0A1S8WUJ8_OPIVI|nr:hypothetical protein X801_05942 [Opisthorchis viverrini]